jgi:hypothetical protein
VLTRFPDVSVAWPATRAVLLSGNTEPYVDVKSGGRLASVLGIAALEVLVCAGAPADIEAFQKIARRFPPSPALLSAAARFGHPGVWAYLLHHLAHAELGDAAARALVTLFGPIVPDAQRADANAWKAAITAQKLESTTRYRRGDPWRAGVVAAECRGGELPRAEIEARLDELAIRRKMKHRADLSRWTADLELELTAFMAEATKGEAPVT